MLVAVFKLLNDGTGPEGTDFVTRADVRELLLEREKAPAAPSVESLEGTCDITRVVSKMPFKHFLKEFHNRPAILSNETGIGKLVFDIQPNVAGKYLKPEYLSQCLCQAKHGTNFHDTTAEAVRPTCSPPLPALPSSTTACM